MLSRAPELLQPRLESELHLERAFETIIGPHGQRAIDDPSPMLGDVGANRANARDPALDQRPREIQKFGQMIRMPIGLDERVRTRSVERLNQILADTITLRDLYKKHHWQVSGPTFYSLHLLYDEHAKEQTELIDDLAERIQVLGGVAIAMAHDVAEMTKLERPPRDREDVPTQLSRLLEAHEHVLELTREAAHRASEIGDEGSNDLLVSDLIRTNEMQVWFLSEHLVEPAQVLEAATERAERRAAR